QSHAPDRRDLRRDRRRPERSARSTRDDPVGGEGGARAGALRDQASDQARDPGWCAMRTVVDDRPVVFVDKDGTLIEDLPYNVDPARVRFAPGARDAVRLWGEHGWRIAVITNQSGVARGYFSLDDLDALGVHLEHVVRSLGADWAGFHACPHHPDGINEYAIDCDCRKPQPGLIRRAAAALGVDPATGWFIGDTWMDVVAGRAA